MNSEGDDRRTPGDERGEGDGDAGLVGRGGLDRGAALVVLGIALLAVGMGVSAAVAPDRGVPAASGEERRTLVGIQGGGPGWHKFGSVLLLRGDEVAWRESSADSYFDVTRLENGSVVAGFIDGGYEDCGPYEPPCPRTGFRIISPGPDPRVVGGYSFPVRSMKNSEVHDVEPLPGGGWLLTDMDRERIVVVEGGEVVWQWRAAGFYDAPPDPTRRDWLHINDVDRLGDGRYLVSVRNANQLLVVKRGEGVVEVVNADREGSSDESCTGVGQLKDFDGDGDVRCGNPALLDHQHNPQWLGDGAVLVADSDNDRVVELHRGEDGRWRVAWTLREAGGLELRWPRDADRLPNGNTLITDTLNKRILEVRENGSVVWSRRTERIPYEADRLPAGERPEGVRYSVAGDGAGREDGDVPLLSTLLVVLKAGFPGLPVWYTEPQVGLTLVSLALVVGGGWTRIRERR